MRHLTKFVSLLVLLSYLSASISFGQDIVKVSDTSKLERSYHSIYSTHITLRAETIKFRTKLSSKELFNALVSINDIESASHIILSAITLNTLVSSLDSPSKQSILVISGSYETKLQALDLLQQRLISYAQDINNKKLKGSLLEGVKEVEASILILKKLRDKAIIALEAAAPEEKKQEQPQEGLPDKNVSVAGRFAEGYQVPGKGNNSYPISDQTNKECMSFLVILKVFHSSLSERNLLTKDFYVKSSLLVMESNAQDILNIFNRIMNLIALEKVHGKHGQFNKTSINMIKMQLPSQAYLLDECITCIKEVPTSTPNLEDTQKKLLGFAEKAQMLFQKIGDELNEFG